MPGFRFALSACLSFLLAVPALADWQGIPFGISEEELKERLPRIQVNQNRGADSESLKARYVAGYRVKNVLTQAYFSFDDAGTLQRISLTAHDDDDCATLTGIANITYGKPEKRVLITAYHLSRWRDTAGGNLVFLMEPVRPGIGCSISYQPIPTPGAKGGL